MFSATSRVIVAKAGLGALTLFSSVFALGEPSFILHPLFQGSLKGGGLVPLVAVVTNDGTETTGTLRVLSGSYSMSYPVKLAPNSTQEVQILLPVAENGKGELPVIDLQTGTRRISRKIDPSIFVRGTGTSILEIGGEVGNLSFTEAIQPGPLVDSLHYGQTAAWSAAYAAPNLVPARPAAFESFHFVLLGKGAERLTDEAVKALKNYMLLGGIVVIPGGPSSVSTVDTRWFDVLPGHPGPVKSVSNAQPISHLCNWPVSGSFKAWPLELRKGSRSFMGPDVLVASRPYGLGEAVQFAFDPFDGVLKDWQGRNDLFGLIGLDTGVSFRSLRDIPVNVRPNNIHDAEGAANSPFELKMPKAQRIGWILIAYVVVVLPINFLVLQLMDRRELAWFTAPLISLAFAVGVLVQASALYRLPTAHRTTAVAVSQDDSPTMGAIGRTEIFFARGGEYDLRLQSVDSLSPGYSSHDPRLAQETGTRELRPMDTGKEVQIRATNVPNLTFRAFGFRQFAPASLMKVSRRSDGFRIEALTKIEGAQFQSPEGRFPLGDLEVGETRFVPFSNLRSVIITQDRSSNKLDDVARALSKRQIVVWGVAPSLQFGTALGEATRCSTTFIYLARDVQ